MVVCEVLNQVLFREVGLMSFLFLLDSFSRLCAHAPACSFANLLVAIFLTLGCCLKLFVKLPFLYLRFSTVNSFPSLSKEGSCRVSVYGCLRILYCYSTINFFATFPLTVSIFATYKPLEYFETSILDFSSFETNCPRLL